MPLEAFNGLAIPPLLKQAQRRIGNDAVVLSVRRIMSDRSAVYELLAADPDTAHDWKAADESSDQPDSASVPMPARPRPLPAGNPVIVALVGPTGSGKTTTIAKLANHPAAFGGSRVGFVSLDTYRIGGVEQSRIYAELSKIPLEVVYDTSDIPRALRRLQGCDVLLLDTAGRGPSRQFDVANTRTLLCALNPYEVHLTLPAGLLPRRAHGIIEEYRPYGVTHVIATKTDECPDDDTPFQVAAEHSLPMLWATNGQEVPEDLRTISKSRSTDPLTTPIACEGHVLETV